MMTLKEEARRKRERDRCLATLKNIALRQQTARDEEADHSLADAALLELIDDREISEAWDAISKWYA